MKIIRSLSYNPFINLAYEDYLFRKLGPGEKILLFYVNRPCVVMGKFQNPWRELHLEAIERDGLDIVRRQSGGGCVYQDLGNLNYSFLSRSASGQSAAANLDYIVSLLEKISEHQYSSDDDHNLFLQLAGGEKLKIGGSAFKNSRDRHLHHGTLLFSANLENVWKYLRRSPLVLEGRQVESKRKKVGNINLSAPFEKVLAACLGKLTLLTEHHLKTLPLEKLSLYQSPEWIFHSTPKFQMGALTIDKGQVLGPYGHWLKLASLKKWTKHQSKETPCR